MSTLERSQYDLAETSLNLRDFPLLDPGSEGWRNVTRRLGDQMVENGGVCVLENLFTQEGVARGLQELEVHEPRLAEKHRTLYHTLGPEELGPEHPRNRQVLSRARFIAGRHLDPDGFWYSLYRFEPLLRFVAAVVGKSPGRNLFRSDDPSGQLYGCFYEPGDYMGWHFDEQSFELIVSLEQDDVGGDFLYIGDMYGITHTEEDQDLHPIPERVEQTYREIDALLAEDPAMTSRIRRVSVAPGSAYIIQGRHTLHMVDWVEKPRKVLIMGFVTRTGFSHSDLLTRQTWGR